MNMQCSRRSSEKHILRPGISEIGQGDSEHEKRDQNHNRHYGFFHWDQEQQQNWNHEDRNDQERDKGFYYEIEAV